MRTPLPSTAAGSICCWCARDNIAAIDIDDRVRVTGLAGWQSYLPWVRKKRRREFRCATEPLAAWLSKARPDALISADVLANLTALEARRRASWPVPLILTQRTHTSTFIAGKFNRKKS